MAIRTGFLAQNAAAVTPHDTNTIPPTLGLYVGGAGNIAVRMWKGAEVTFTGVAAGSVLPIMVDRVDSTSTTATTILALY